MCVSESYVLQYTVEWGKNELRVLSLNNLPDSNVIMHIICFTLIDWEMFDATVP